MKVGRAIAQLALDRYTGTTIEDIYPTTVLRKELFYQ